MNTESSDPQMRQRELSGEVVKNKMNKSVIVKISRLVKHARYHKHLTSSKNVMAHDEKNVTKVGDQVVIRECRPLSKHKSWVVKEVLGSAQ